MVEFLIRDVCSWCHSTSFHVPRNCGPQTLLVEIAAQRPVSAAFRVPTAQRSVRADTVEGTRIGPDERDDHQLVARHEDGYPRGELTTSMSEYEATFEIDSKTDSYAARRILEQAYDTVREESRSVREGSDDASELLQEFKTLRDAAKHPTAGELTITYEQYDDEFDD